MKKIICLALLVSLIILSYACNVAKANKANNQNDNNVDTVNYVPNEETAIKIAEAIWLPIYGEKIYNQKPYIVSLVNDSIWVVTGTLAENKRGGVAYIEIQKKDCKVLKVIHGK